MIDPTRIQFPKINKAFLQGIFWLIEVELMRQVWIQQYYYENGQVKWRADQDLPPNQVLIQSPYDVEARNRTKRSLNWTGYMVHFTETCDEDSPNVIVNVETVAATTADVDVVEPIHRHLAEKALLPGEHLVDTAYVEAEQLHRAQTKYDLDLIGPAHLDGSWQAKAAQGFGLACFAIDWEAKTVTCPQNHLSQTWYPTHHANGDAIIQVKFSPTHCCACATREQCTTNKIGGRVLHFKTRPHYEALQNARQRQQTDQFKKTYNKRAGIEGTFSQATRTADLRRSRYIGLAKTHLQHVATAAGLNLSRVWSWLNEKPKAHTRLSKFMSLSLST